MVFNFMRLPGDLRYMTYILCDVGTVNKLKLANKQIHSEVNYMNNVKKFFVIDLYNELQAPYVMGTCLNIERRHQVRKNGLVYGRAWGRHGRLFPFSYHTCRPIDLERAAMVHKLCVYGYYNSDTKLNDLVSNPKPAQQLLRRVFPKLTHLVITEDIGDMNSPRIHMRVDWSSQTPWTLMREDLGLRMNVSVTFQCLQLPVISGPWRLIFKYCTISEQLKAWQNQLEWQKDWLAKWRARRLAQGKIVERRPGKLSRFDQDIQRLEKHIMKLGKMKTKIEKELKVHFSSDKAPEEFETTLQKQLERACLIQKDDRRIQTYPTARKLLEFFLPKWLSSTIPNDGKSRGYRWSKTQGQYIPSSAD